MSEKALFSLQELDFAQEPIYVLMKNRVLEKVEQQWAYNAEKIAASLDKTNFEFPIEIKKKQWKISKGENHKGLPYRVLDFPAYFHKNDIFAFRLIFLWGHHFAMHFQLHGKFLKTYKNSLMKHFDEFQKKEFSAGVSLDPWQHINIPNNYQKFESLSLTEWENQMDEINYLKISKFEPISKIDLSADYFILFINNILKCINNENI